MTPLDIVHLTNLDWPTLAPDGRRAVVAARRADLKIDNYRSQLWLVTVDRSSPPRLLTHGKHDSTPSFSPDGRLLAFLRAYPGGKPQLHIMATDGGEPRQVTSLPLGVGPPKWSPDSRSIAFVARAPEPKRYEQDETVTAEKEPPRRITGLQYRLDGVGFLTDRRQHVYVVDVCDSDDSPDPRQLTDGEYDDADVCWSPDGQWLAFTSSRHAGREHSLIRDLFLLPLAGGGATRLTDSSLMLAAPSFTRDGRSIVALGRDPSTGVNGVEHRTGLVARNTGLFAVLIDTGGRPSRLTDEEQLHLSGERVVVTDDAVLVLVENRGAIDLISIPLHGDAPSTLAAGKQQIDGFDEAAGTIVVTIGDAVSCPELAVLLNGEAKRLTDFTSRLRKHVLPRPITEIMTTAPDGYPVHGFIVEPEGVGPHPVLLMIHGGPFTQYGWQLFDEAQVYADAGYAVVYGNPRGSSGYGQANGTYILHDVGERSAPDLLALLDAALQRPHLDGARVGVLGGSHGGYMTTWLIGHTDRFRAAVSERGVNAIDSFEGTSDLGWGFAEDLYGPDPEQRHKQSPLTYADAVTTPLLIIHSESDWRCPIEQAQRLYVALRSRNAIVEFLLFPGEGHEMSRTGLPSHRVARFDAILEWLGRYLRQGSP